MIVSYGEIGANAWNDFCSSHKAAWFWHTTYFLDYLSVDAQNFSFGLLDADGALQGIWPLVLRHGKPVDGYPLPRPLFNDLSHDDLDKCSKHIRCVNGFNGMILPHLIRGSALSQDLTRFPHDVRGDAEALLLFPYLKDAVVMSREHFPQAWHGVRKSYRSLIKQAQKKYVFEVNPPDWMTWGPLLHAKTRGGETRPKGTWEHWFRWIVDGWATVFGVLDGYRYIGFAIALHYKDCSYHAMMSVELPNVSAFLVWNVAKYLFTKRKDHMFEIGWHGMAANEKEQSIEFFRSGLSKERAKFLVMPSPFPSRL